LVHQSKEGSAFPVRHSAFEGIVLERRRVL
jgi:hypothetical protein